MMHRDRIWAGGPVTAAMRTGAPAGLVYGLIQLALTGSAPRALFGAVFFGTIFGALMVGWMRRRWPRSSTLASEDRVAVARAVRTGEEIRDERLVDAVIDYAVIVREAQEREARANWVLVVFAVGTSIFAITSTVAGSTREALVFWLLTGFWVVSLAWVIPRQRARAITNAHRAEQAARARR